MRIAIFAYSRQGCRTADIVRRHFAKQEVRCFTMERFAEEGFEPLCRPSKPFYGEMFAWADGMVFVGSCGIAVRQIAPHVHDKQTDPAVMVIDELGHFVIPLLSGHIGGANAMAKELAAALTATPVITTATDINHKFSVDAWAVQNGCVISDIRRAKAVSARILEQNVPLCSDFPIVTPCPSGVVSGISGEVGITISCKTDEPFAQTLRLIPKVLHLGIGCRKGTPVESIREAVDTVFAEHHIDKRAINCVASIDLKAEEAGLLAYCAESNLPVRFYSARDLQAVEGDFTPSAFVQSITGVDNVCERAALLGAEHLMINKTARNGVTVAAAAEKWEVRFE